MPISDLFGVAGGRLLNDVALGRAFAIRLKSLRDLIAVYDVEVDRLDRELGKSFKGHRGYQAIQALAGVGAVLGGVFVAGIGDVTRFANPARLCSWAGLTPRHRESDTTVHRGPITKQGSTFVRWAAVEAVVRSHGGVTSLPPASY